MWENTVKCLLMINIGHQKAFNSEKATVEPDITLAYPDLTKPVKITQIPHGNWDL